MMQLAANGFPVWMMNQRGTDYSRDNTKLEVESKEFWDFDLTDMWKDIEANVEIIYTATGYDEVFYVGYSGATS